MNRIFKKIWNKHRGCFVAVSEAMTSASQRAGKAAITVALGAMAASAVQAAYVYNGDWYKGTLNGRNGHEYPMAADMTITGNFYFLTPASSDEDIFFIADTDGTGGYLDAVMTVNGNVYLAADVSQKGGSRFTIANSNHGTNAVGVLNAKQDVILTNNARLLVADAARTTTVGTLNVSGTLNIESGAVSMASMYKQDNARSYAYANINNMLVSGLFQTGYSTSGKGYGYSTTNVNTVTINNGGWVDLVSDYVDTTFTVNNSLTLNAGGGLTTKESLIIGSAQTNRTTIAQTLNLNGGYLSNCSLLTQNQGTVNVGGGSYGFDTYNKTSGTLTNASTLSITNFNQSNGATTNSGNLTIGNANLYGTLSNTGTLNLTGTVTSRGNLSSTGTLNNKGSWTEANAYTISGNLNNTGSVNFQNGFTLASNSRLTSSGTLQTNNAYNIFDSLGTTGQQDLHYVSLNSSVPQEVKTSLSDFFQKYVAGTVAQDLINHASFTGGKVIITGVNLTQTQADDLASAFKSKNYLPFS